MGWYDPNSPHGQFWYHVDWAQRTHDVPPSVQWHCDRWLEDHLDLDPDKLQQEIARFDSDARNARQDLMRGGRDNEQLLLRRLQIAETLKQQLRLAIDYKKGNRPRPRVANTGEAAPAKTDQDAGENSWAFFDSKDPKLHERHERALKKALANEPMVKEIQRLERTAADGEVALNNVLDRAEAGKTQASDEEL